MTDKNFFTKLPYLIFVSLVTLILWYKGLEMIGIPIFLGVIFVIFIFCKNSIYTFPYIINMLFMISQTDWNLDLIPIYLYIAPGVVVLGIIIHSIRFKVKIFKGEFIWGVTLLGIAIVASVIINTTDYNIISILGFGYPIMLVFLYGFLANSIRGENLLYLIRILVIVGIMISLQVFLYYLDIYLVEGSQGVHHALETKEIDLGWGISNFVATYLIMFIVCTTYFIKKYKLHIFWIVLFLFEITMLLFTLSRAGILAFAATAIFLILYLFIKYDHKLNLLLNFLGGIIIVGAAVYFLREYFFTIFERLERLWLDDSGRINLWEEAIQIIKTNSIFGRGIFARSIGVGDNELRMFHNTILHTLASFGILGGLALIVQFISILRIFLYKLNQEKAILLIAIIGANIHGMVDNVYFMPQYMIIMFIIIAVVENATRVDKLREELRIS